MHLFYVTRLTNKPFANRTKSKTLILMAAVAVLALSPISVTPAAQPHKFTTIDVPGASFPFGTTPSGINSHGDIVGGYYDSDFNLHSFLLSKGKFMAIDVPGAVQTQVVKINPQGGIVGNYYDSSFNLHGFLLSKGKFTTIDVPGARLTQASGINAQGEIVGNFVETSSFHTHGFLLSNGAFTTIDVPGAVHTQPSAINPRGEIVGDYF